MLLFFLWHKIPKIITKKPKITFLLKHLILGLLYIRGVNMSYDEQYVKALEEHYIKLVKVLKELIRENQKLKEEIKK